MTEGHRSICITFYYDKYSGVLVYAASIFRKPRLDYIMTIDEIDGHEYTTTRRYNIRPARVNTYQYMDYNSLIEEIRWQMIHGPGCKGPRNKHYDYEDVMSTSSDSGSEHLSTTSAASTDVSVDEDAYQVRPQTFSLKTVNKFMYYIISDEPFENCPQTIREFMVSYKGSKSTGDLIYGASISRRGYDTNTPYLSEREVDAHFKTSHSRLEKCPVQMNIPQEYRHQLLKNSSHDEDVMYTIMDQIYERRKGKFQIKGARL